MALRAGLARRRRPRHGLVVEYGDDLDGYPSVLLGDTASPCPGVALRFNAVIDCRPGESRMPPVTIDFLTKPPPSPPAVADPQSELAGAGAGAGQAKVAGRFTCSSGDFILFSPLRKIQELVAAAGLPPECAPDVARFCRECACSATNTFYKAVAITVEVDAPPDDDEEELPAGAAVGECSICYRLYLVGGEMSVKLPCSHTFHRSCLDRWTDVSRTCPYCRGSVPLEDDYCYEEEHDGDDFSDDQ
ncbi:hypothetical protein ACP4OV_006053 [Aristida adscensionis]